jgi:protein-L-isoaspartate(D-aspartate) O-methyltransferase
VDEQHREAQTRNERLVSQLEENGTLTDPAVATAFRAVLRHRFLPGRQVSDVYEDAAIMTKVLEDGVAVSSSSQPAIMAIMLQQLQVRPGHRVLEIGAGTGYNAALLSRLAGRDGHVVTMDIDEDTCQEARAHLAAAGISDVEVVRGDGAGGWPAGAPYDRLILAASSSDIAPAWRDQLVEEGVIVLPLVLVGPMQLCVAFRRRGSGFVSTDVTCCGFMPLRGAMAVAAEPSERPRTAWLREEGRPAAHTVSHTDLAEGFETWLALTENGYVRRVSAPEDPPSFGFRDEHGLALVTGSGREHPVLVYGEGEAAAQRLVEAHIRWSRRRPRVDRFRVAAHPSGEELEPPGDARVLRRKSFTFVVTAP